MSTTMSLHGLIKKGGLVLGILFLASVMESIDYISPIRICPGHKIGLKLVVAT